MPSEEENNSENMEEKSEKQEVPNEVQLEKKTRNEVLREEFDKLRSDVDKMSQELRSAVTELKKSIVDIRSAVSEIENPFNLLRSISSEEDLKKLERKKLPPGVKSLILGKPKKEEAPEEEKTEQKPPLLEEEKLPLLEEEKPPLLKEGKPLLLRKEKLETPLTEIEEPKLQVPQPEMPRIGPKYLDWVWSLLDSGMSADDVLQLAHAYEFMGYLPSQSSEHVYSLAVACERARSKGFSKSRMLLNMYRAAVISGVKVGLDDVEKVISIAEGEGEKRGGEG